MVINGKNVAFKINGKIYHCALDVTMSYIGGRWKTVVLWYLRKRTMRFAELKKHIPEITEKMLSIQLKKLEAEGIIKREVFGTKPPLHTEYSLSEFGKTLVPAIEAIAEWGRNLGYNKGEIVDIEH